MIIILLIIEWIGREDEYEYEYVSIESTEDIEETYPIPNDACSCIFKIKDAINEKLNNVYYVGASTHPGTGLPIVVIGSRLVTERIINEH